MAITSRARSVFTKPMAINQPDRYSINRVVDFAGYRTYSGNPVHEPGGFLHEAVLPNEAMSSVLRNRLAEEVSYAGVSADRCWKALGQLGKGLVPYQGGPLAAGDFGKLSSGALAFITRTSPDGKPVEALCKGYSLTLRPLREEEISSSWRPEP